MGEGLRIGLELLSQFLRSPLLGILDVSKWITTNTHGKGVLWVLKQTFLCQSILIVFIARNELRKALMNYCKLRLVVYRDQGYAWQILICKELVFLYITVFLACSVHSCIQTKVSVSPSAVDFRIVGHSLVSVSIFKPLRWFDKRIVRIPKYISKHW